MNQVLDLDAIRGRATTAHEWLKRDQRAQTGADWLPLSMREHFEHDFPAVVKALDIFAAEVERLTAQADQVYRDGYNIGHQHGRNKGRMEAIGELTT